MRRLGCAISAKVSDWAAEPLAQIGFIAACIAWFVSGLPVEVLTATLSILAITLTQMVLNKQNEREARDSAREAALQKKADELIHAVPGARDELAGLEKQS